MHKILWNYDIHMHSYSSLLSYWHPKLAASALGLGKTLNNLHEKQGFLKQM